MNDPNEILAAFVNHRDDDSWEVLSRLDGFPDDVIKALAILVSHVILRIAREEDNSYSAGYCAGSILLDVQSTAFKVFMTLANPEKGSYEEKKMISGVLKALTERQAEWQALIENSTIKH